MHFITIKLFFSRRIFDKVFPQWFYVTDSLTNWKVFPFQTYFVASTCNHYCNIILILCQQKKSWYDYNESLIERGRVLIDVGFLISTNIEIQKINQGKVGVHSNASHSYIHFLAFIKIGFKIAYRTVQGITRKGLSDYIRRIEEMHFTHIRRRMLKIWSSVGQLNFEENDKPITLIVDDASGLTNYIKERRLHRGEMGLREKKEYLKLPYLTVDDEKSKKVIV